MEIREVLPGSKERRDRMISAALLMAAQRGSLGDFYETMNENQQTIVVGALVDAEWATMDTAKETK